MMGCERSNSVSDLYKFSDKKDIRVQINIEYKLNIAGGPNVEVDRQQFLLNAFLTSENNLQVELGIEGENLPEYDLPLMLSGTQLSFAATVRMPASIMPKEDGYTLHFALKEIGSENSLALDGSVQSTVKNLEALRGGIQPGADPLQNPVTMSLATTLAFKIAKNSGVDGTSIDQVNAYQKLLSAIEDRLKSVEDLIDPDSTPDLTTFASAVLAGIKYEILRDAKLQTTMTSILDPVIKSQNAANVSTENSKSTLADSFSQMLKTFSSDVITTIGISETKESKLFKPEKVVAAEVVEVASYSSVVYAPIVHFSDTDPDTTIGGIVTVTPPKSGTAPESYNVFLGGERCIECKDEINRKHRQRFKPQANNS